MGKAVKDYTIEDWEELLEAGLSNLASLKDTAKITLECIELYRGKLIELELIAADTDEAISKLQYGIASANEIISMKKSKGGESHVHKSGDELLDWYKNNNPNSKVGRL